MKRNRTTWQWTCAKACPPDAKSTAGACAGMVCIALTSLALALPALAAPLPAGTRIEAPASCTTLPGMTLDGTKTGFGGVETSGAYVAMTTPDLPGGHWEISGQYPRAEMMSFQAFNQFMSVDGFIEGKDVAPDPGSVNPWQPGNLFVEGQDRYTLRISFDPPELRETPPPPGVMYVGWRNGKRPTKMGILQTMEGAPIPFGSVPNPTATWVVDDPSKNIIKDVKHLCRKMYRNAQPFQWIFHAASDYSIEWEQRQTNYLYNQWLPLILDPTSGRDGYIHVNAARPSPKGYSYPAAAQSALYTSIAPNPKYGKFFVIRAKVPTSSRVTQGIPNTGQEQVGYWVWCGVQVYSWLVNTTACLKNSDAEIDSDGYVTMVVSPKDERPVINGKPYKNWLQHPAAGGLIWLEEYGPSKENYPQSPYFAPASMALHPTAPILSDVVYWNKEKELKAHWGEYFPEVYFCDKQTFEAGQCKYVPPAPKS